MFVSSFEEHERKATNISIYKNGEKMAGDWNSFRTAEEAGEYYRKNIFNYTHDAFEVVITREQREFLLLD